MLMHTIRGVAVGAVAASAAVLAAPAAYAGGSGLESQGGSSESSKDKGGRDVWALLRDEEVPDVSPHILVDFFAYGEKLNLQDNRKDGHEVVAHLTVAGEGTATFRGVDLHDLSYAEGKDVSLQVCLGDTGICSKTYSGGRT